MWEDFCLDFCTLNERDTLKWVAIILCYSSSPLKNSVVGGFYIGWIWCSLSLCCRAPVHLALFVPKFSRAQFPWRSMLQQKQPCCLHTCLPPPGLYCCNGDLIFFLSGILLRISLPPLVSGFLMVLSTRNFICNPWIVLVFWFPVYPSAQSRTFCLVSVFSPLQTVNT